MITATDVRMAEYDKLKDEQLSRIHTRNNLMYTTLAALAAVGWAAITLGNVDVWLAAPAVGLVLGWWYLDEDRMVFSLRRRFQRLSDELAVDLGVLDGPRLLEWEFPRAGSDGRLRRVSRLGVRLGLFVLPGVVALTVWAQTDLTGADPVHVVGWVAGVVAMAGLAAAFVHNSFARRR